MPVCLIALGSNVDASEAVFRDAVRELRRIGVETRALSTILTTRPVGSAAGPPFLNAAATVESHLSPIELLHVLHRIEAVFGRTRTVHWGPRTLDLDLLLYGTEIIDQPNLVIPHPAMWYRRFVLDPAYEVAAEMQHPVLKSTIRSLHEALHVRPLCVRLSFSATDPELPHDLNALTEQLNADQTGLEWLSANDHADDVTLCFAHVILQRSAIDSILRTQPRHTNDRTIIVESDSASQSYLHLSNLAAAILG